MWDGCASCHFQNGVGADLTIISTPGRIQFTNYLCRPGSPGLKHHVNPIILGLPSLPGPSVFPAQAAQGLSTGPWKTRDFILWEKARLVLTRVQTPLNCHFSWDKSKWCQLSIAIWKSRREHTESPGKKGERRKKGLKDKHAKHRSALAVVRGLFPHAAFHITSERQMTIRLLQTHDNTVRNQELKYSEGPRPPLRGGWEGGRRESRLRARPPPSTWTDSVPCGSPGLAVWEGDWHLLCWGEGAGSYWQPCCVHLHTFGSSSVATHTKKESSKQRDISWNGIFVFTNDCSAASTWHGARKHV